MTKRSERIFNSLVKGVLVFYILPVAIGTIVPITHLSPPVLADAVKNCEFIPRSGRIATPSGQKIIRVPVKDDIATKNGISTMIMLHDEPEIKAHIFVKTGEEDAWKASQYLVAVVQKQGDSGFLISFEENVHHSELEHRYLLVIVVPKTEAKNIKIQPFNNEGLKHFNSAIFYRVQNTRSGIISAFEELQTAKNHHEYLSEEMNELLTQSIGMGQIILPDTTTMRNSIIEPLIAESAFCSNYL